MKIIAAIIKHFKLDDVRKALTDVVCRGTLQRALQIKKQRMRTGEKNEEAIQ